MIDRRTTIKWMLAACASVPMLKAMAEGYGTDLDLQKIYTPGELWPLTLSEEQKRTAGALCDLIIPADAHSPSASAVGVVAFIDEWISAPYPRQKKDRELILTGLAWLDAESGRRFSKPFAAAEAAQQTALCDDICYLPKAAPALKEAAQFFARYRDLTAGGFYTTPEGFRDLKYVGNVPLPSFEGPPLEVLKAAGLT
jgi:hypothetical protein